MPLTASRKIAFQILARVERTASYATELLNSRLTAGLKEEDRRLVHELVFGVLRWQGQLDFLLEKLAAKSLSRRAGWDWEVRLALRLGLYQIRFLERIPKAAAVDQSVELVKFARKRSAASLVNAVLRKAGRRGPIPPPAGPAPSAEPLEEFLPQDLSPAERLAILHSHPTWWVERWLEAYGPDHTESLLASNNEHAPVSCRLVTLQASREEILALVATGDIAWEEGRWIKDAITIRGGNVQRSEAFRRGWLAIQDEASQMVGLLLAPRPGDRVLDLCCAPGGKTAQLAALLDPRGNPQTLFGADFRLHRLRRTRTLLHKVGVNTVPLVALDGGRPLPFGVKFDRILVDAPCSGTGTLARHPEIRWRLKPEDLSDLHRRQVALLRSALASLAPGGRLVYATCSLEREENEEVVEEGMSVQADIRRLAAAEGSEALRPHLREPEVAQELFDREGYFRTFPPEHHTDGFFAALFERAP